MKNHLTILALILICQFGFGQDKLNTKDNQQLIVQVIEKTNKIVKYKMIDYEEGPVIWIKINRLSSIEYKNGIIDILGLQNPRQYKPLGINAGFAMELSGGGGLFLTTLDYFAIPQIELEVNLGTSDFSGGFYFSAGSRFHLNSKYSETRLTPFAGLLFGTNYGNEFFQFPVGINYLFKPGLNTSVSLNNMFGFDSWHTTFIELRVGWRFKR